MKPLSERLNLYMDAGFPILYIATFEEDKADRVIHEAVGNREIVECSRIVLPGVQAEGR